MQPVDNGWATGCIAYTNIQPVVQPFWQPVVSRKRSFTYSLCDLEV